MELISGSGVAFVIVCLKWWKKAVINPIPLLALSTVAFGYFGAINQIEPRFQSTPAPTVTGFAAAPNLSVQEYVGTVPQTLQDPLCAAKDIIAEDLHQDFAETLEASWDQNGSATMEVWTSDVMGTWTMLRVENAGLACIVASGFGWTEGMTAEDVVQIRPLS